MAGHRKDEKDLQKRIQKELRSITRARKRARIGSILEEFKGLKFITRIRKNEKRQLIGSVRDKDGVLKTDRQEIADIFAILRGAVFIKPRQ
jgi:hypothetical protein